MNLDSSEKSIGVQCRSCQFACSSANCKRRLRCCGSNLGTLRGLRDLIWPSLSLLRTVCVLTTVPWALINSPRRSRAVLFRFRMAWRRRNRSSAGVVFFCLPEPGRRLKVFSSRYLFHSLQTTGCDTLSLSATYRWVNPSSKRVTAQVTSSGTKCLLMSSTSSCLQKPIDTTTKTEISKHAESN